MLKDDADCLKYAIRYMPNLEVLNLSDNHLQEDGTRSVAFSFSIDNDTRIEHEFLSDMSFYDCRNLFPFLIEKSQCETPLTELYLDNCGIPCHGASQLLKVLAACKVPLKSLSIGRNYLSRLVS